MRMSQLYSQTLREAPGDVDVVSHQLLLRAGYIRQLAAGIFSNLPLAYRSMLKIENIMRDEINAIGGQEIKMPVVHPAEIWQKTNRWFEIGSEMGRFKDKNERDMVLAMTHEEIVADLTSREIQSYRQLPVLIYHLQTKWRDDPRPRAGLIRVREFVMLDSYSLDATMESLHEQYLNHYQAYFNIFNRTGVPAIAVASDVGMMGGTMAHEFMYLTPIGEDTLLLCGDCGYQANREVATFVKSKGDEEGARDIEKVATPDAKTIADLAVFLDVPKSKTAKALFLVATVPGGKEDKEDFVDKLVFAIVRGEMDLSEAKLTNVLKAKQIRPAREDEIIAIGAVPGYASPVGLDLSSVLTVVDDIIPASPNLVAGANDAGFHLLNTNYGRDYEADIVADIAAARDGDACPECQAALDESRGVEIGNIFKLGTRYSSAMGANFLAKNGKPEPVIMGSYGIGVGRLLACAAEEHNDEYGLKLPITIAPYEVHLVGLRGGDEEAEQLYVDLQAAGLEVLFDDRNENPGVKFNDADLIGVPLRLTVGKRSLKNGGVEMKLRHESERSMVALDATVETAVAQVKALYDAITERVVEVPFKE